MRSTTLRRAVLTPTFCGGNHGVDQAGRRERRHPWTCHLCLHATLRRCLADDRAAVGTEHSERHSQPLPGRVCGRWRDPHLDVGGHHAKQQLGCLGARLLPELYRPDHRNAKALHELPWPGNECRRTPNHDLFFFSLYDQPQYLDYYNSLHNGGTLHTLPYNAQYKCYDSMHIWNQIQPAPYDGFYQFPSTIGIDPTSGARPERIDDRVNDPDSSDHYRTAPWAESGL